ncbi:sugar ABC transporter substrate-binding protein [Candidatus Oscillochloris fontis]|uniref:sugar ABC transporter substrate-binding protein n=1 Tax=Candidatus Oscillochloris fontis TaxID=2496868 RepID=UPI001EE7EE18|nr:sugar ABC transporter substrate-binding protein [Candidatus Oscillochloris fontis]
MRHTNNIHTFWILATLLLIVDGLVGCSQPAPNLSLIEPTNTRHDAEQQVSSGQPHIALVMKTLTNPFFAEMERGARMAESELGITLIVKTAAQETSIDQQIAIIERLILDQVDAIVVAPGDSTSLVPVLRRAQEAGIVIVNVDNRLDESLVYEMGLVGVPFISVDNVDGAYQAAQMISQRITTPTEVIVLEGIPTAQNAIDRTNGARKAFAENPNITIVAIESAHWKIDESYEVTSRLLKEHPQVGAIFCANDMMAFGSLKYLEEIGRSDVLVAGFDALPEARVAVSNGRLVATIDQQAAQQGYLGVQYAVQLLAGEQLPAETLIPVQLIDQ